MKPAAKGDTTSSHPFTPASPDIVVRRVGDGGVLVDLRTNAIFELNDTGMRVWELIVEGLGLDEMAARLTEEFDVTAGDGLAACRELVDALRAEGLLR
ncbi:MAG TPA: PqqD family protein [Vicinamibacterales bacterium]|nr:PqqD family protein [Vicinamibacterales bacterium]